LAIREFDRITLLRDDLNASLHDQLATKQLIVTHYGIYWNRAQALRNLTYGPMANPVSAVMSGMGTHCKREEIQAGWFGPDDVTTPYSPVIVEITMTVDGKRHQIRSVYSPPKEVSFGLQFPDASAAIFAAIKKATDELIAELANDLKS